MFFKKLKAFFSLIWNEALDDFGRETIQYIACVFIVLGSLVSLLFLCSVLGMGNNEKIYWWWYIASLPSAIIISYAIYFASVQFYKLCRVYWMRAKIKVGREKYGTKNK